MTGSSEAQGFWQSLESSLLAAVAYDAALKQLKVRIAGSGKEYVYYEVEKQVVDEMLAGESPGAYFNRHIRDHYRYKRI